MADVTVDAQGFLVWRSSNAEQAQLVRLPPRASERNAELAIHESALAKPRQRGDAHLSPSQVRLLALELLVQLARNRSRGHVVSELRALIAVQPSDQLVLRQVCVIVYRELWRRWHLARENQLSVRYCPRDLDDDDTFGHVREMAHGLRDKNAVPPELDSRGNPRLRAGALRVRTGLIVGVESAVWTGEAGVGSVGPNLGRARNPDFGWHII